MASAASPLWGLTPCGCLEHACDHLGELGFDTRLEARAVLSSWADPEGRVRWRIWPQRIRTRE